MGLDVPLTCHYRGGLAEVTAGIQQRIRRELVIRPHRLKGMRVRAEHIEMVATVSSGGTDTTPFLSWALPEGCLAFAVGDSPAMRQENVVPARLRGKEIAGAFTAPAPVLDANDTE